MTGLQCLILSIFSFSAMHTILGGPVTRSGEYENVIHAEKYLQRFGYLTSGNSLHEIKSFKQALRNFQHMMGLKETGILDKDTEDMMRQPRCGVPDTPPDADPNNNQPLNYYSSGYKWKKTDLTWKITEPTYKLSLGSQRRAIHEAMEQWSKVSPLRFTETSDDTPDINIRFAYGEHGDGPYNSFDGRGGILAHAYYPDDGGMHFDESEDWTQYTDKGTDLMMVAAHELGHALGLGHSNIRGSLMWPTYQGYTPTFKMGYDDILGIQSLYGGPSRPNTKPEEETERPTSITTPSPTPTTCTPCTTILPDHTNAQGEAPDTCSIKYDAVIQGHDQRILIFRGKWVWRTEDTYGLDPGFPKLISEVYDSNPPINIRGAVYSPITMFSYLFKGKKIWKYWGHQLVKVKTILNPLWPSKIQAMFTDQNGTIYIFTGKYYYILNEKTLDLEDSKARLIEDRFPGVSDNIESAVRLQDGYIYFFKGGGYKKYDDNNRRVLDGYPKPKADPWMGPACANTSFTPK